MNYVLNTNIVLYRFYDIVVIFDAISRLQHKFETILFVYNIAYVLVYYRFNVFSPKYFSCTLIIKSIP